MNRLLRIGLVICMSVTMSGCFSWMRAYQTYLQLDDFDDHFAISYQYDDDFNLLFKDPILYGDDFTSISKIQPTEVVDLAGQKRWRYVFKKVDKENNVLEPEVTFYFDLILNEEGRLARWVFSPMFLQMAPAEFLEASIRSIGGAEINQFKRQLKADTSALAKVNADLPLQAQIIKNLGEPLTLETTEDGHNKLQYYFLLDTKQVEQGFEDRLLSVVDLTFEKNNKTLLKMTGRFAGLKISINYQDLVSEQDQQALKQKQQLNAGA